MIKEVMLKSCRIEAESPQLKVCAGHCGEDLQRIAGTEVEACYQSPQPQILIINQHASSITKSANSFSTGVTFSSFWWTFIIL